jgi:hypothetical protein
MPANVKMSAVRAAAERAFGPSVRVYELAVSYLTCPAVLIKFPERRALRFEGATHSKARSFAIEVLTQLAEAP